MLMGELGYGTWHYFKTIFGQPGLYVHKEVKSEMEEAYCIVTVVECVSIEKLELCSDTMIPVLFCVIEEFLIFAESRYVDNE